MQVPTVLQWVIPPTGAAAANVDEGASQPQQSCLQGRSPQHSQAASSSARTGFEHPDWAGVASDTSGASACCYCLGERNDDDGSVLSCIGACRDHGFHKSCSRRIRDHFHERQVCPVCILQKHSFKEWITIMDSWVPSIGTCFHSTPCVRILREGRLLGGVCSRVYYGEQCKAGAECTHCHDGTHFPLERPETKPNPRMRRHRGSPGDPATLEQCRYAREHVQL